MLLKEIRKQLEDQGLLHLASYRHNKNLSLEDWLRKFINELNYKKNTLDTDGDVDTPSGKRRSIGDIYRIAKTYYPDISFKELCVNLFAIRTEFNDSFCSSIYKHVFYKKSDGREQNSMDDIDYGSWDKNGIDADIEGNMHNYPKGNCDEFGRTLSDYTKLTLNDTKNANKSNKEEIRSKVIQSRINAHG